MGRHRQYTSDAERQAAHRKRVREARERLEQENQALKAQLARTEIKAASRPASNTAKPRRRERAGRAALSDSIRRTAKGSARFDKASALPGR
jgi:hypothetical protein